MSSPESALQHTLGQLAQLPASAPQLPQLLATAKHQLLALDALLPQPATPATHLLLARRTLEAGALHAIRARDPDAFTRYYAQLQPFYELPASRYPSPPSGGGGGSQREKITGLYLLLLLTKGDYAGFHSELEGLEGEGFAAARVEEEEATASGKGREGARGFVEYPIKLERWLMEGAYDRVWAATKREGVPSEEFAVFSEVLTRTIRAEIASCSERAYPSVPIANAKHLLFLDSEGAVVSFARERGWTVRDGRIYFPEVGTTEGGGGDDQAMGDGTLGGKPGAPGAGALVASGQVIENTIGYARELETIV